MTDWQTASDLPISPDAQSADRMWALLEDLFPVYRALCGPGFLESLQRLQRHVDLEISEFPSGKDVFSWTIPKEFSINEAWVEDASGRRVIDARNHSYHVWLYSDRFDGEVDRRELVENIATMPYLPDAIPLRNTYYRDRWGLSASQNQVDALPEGRFRVHIDTEHKDGQLRIGEVFLPGRQPEEILINTYLCHPHGANDNLSGVVVCAELFRLLAALPNRRLSYRLAIWPESIGAITYIDAYPERLKQTIGGYVVAICGDGSPIKYDLSYGGGSLVDRAAQHALRHVGVPGDVRPFRAFASGSDAQHFNSIGVRVPMGTMARAGPGRDGYVQYHSSADDLSVVSADGLLGTLKFTWWTLMALERAETYKGNYTVTPFLSRYGIYPYHHGVGVGTHGNDIARAYYELMPRVDGTQDMLAIADEVDLPVFAFDEPVAAFSKAGLIDRV